jgi:hypothetical protein
MCAIAVLVPAVLVSGSSVASLSSPTGASARSIQPRAWGIARDGNPQNQQPRDHAGQNDLPVESLPHETRQKTQTRSQGRPGRRSVDHDPHGVRSGSLDAGAELGPHDRDIIYPEARKVAPY